ncbi:uncharacterized protein [Argopecten irradians]|uniref:uncharacterized protein n=1 Tax=Argopecten irradians TaxID=31199 RepID=UPI003710F25A
MQKSYISFKTMMAYSDECYLSPESPGAERQHVCNCPYCLDERGESSTRSPLELPPAACHSSSDFFSPEENFVDRNIQLTASEVESCEMIEQEPITPRSCRPNAFHSEDVLIERHLQDIQLNLVRHFSENEQNPQHVSQHHVLQVFGTNVTMTREQTTPICDHNNISRHKNVATQTPSCRLNHINSNVSSKSFYRHVTKSFERRFANLRPASRHQLSANEEACDTYSEASNGDFFTWRLPFRKYNVLPPSRHVYGDCVRCQSTDAPSIGTQTIRSCQCCHCRSSRGGTSNSGSMLRPLVSYHDYEVKRGRACMTMWQKIGLCIPIIMILWLLFFVAENTFKKFYS